MDLLDNMMELMAEMMNKEDKEEMMVKLMGKFFDDIKSKNEQKMMVKIMREAMLNLFIDMEGKDMEPVMHGIIPNVMDKCFSKMDNKERQGMLRMCREILDEIELKYLLLKE